MPDGFEYFSDPGEWAAALSAYDGSQPYPALDTSSPAVQELISQPNYGAGSTVEQIQDPQSYNQQYTSQVTQTGPSSTDLIAAGWVFDPVLGTYVEGTTKSPEGTWTLQPVPGQPLWEPLTSPIIPLPQRAPSPVTPSPQSGREASSSTPSPVTPSPRPESQSPTSPGTTSNSGLHYDPPPVTTDLTVNPSTRSLLLFGLGVAALAVVFAVRQQ